MPIRPLGGHPECLASLDLAEYLAMLRLARARTHGLTSSWTDLNLTATFPLKGDRVSYAWVFYHLLEHFSYHFGQVVTLRSICRSVR